MGQVTGSTQTPAGGSPYIFGYSYYFDGSLATQWYPSSRAVTTCYDNNGRIAWVSKSHSKSDCGNGAVPANGYYAKMLPSDYAAHGAPKEL